jgi:hypothetical protein
MKGDIALAGFVITAEEWEEMDAGWKAQLVAANAPLVPLPVPMPAQMPEHSAAAHVLATGQSKQRARWWPTTGRSRARRRSASSTSPAR